MECSSLTTVLFFLSLLVCNIKSGACQVYNVTSFGAVSGGTNDSTKAFLAAWEAACKFEGKASFVIPQGTFLVGPLEFSGPCHNKSSPKVDIKGKLKALSSKDDFSHDTWIKFQDLNRLNISGGGTLYGQGSLAWPLNTCSKKRECHMLPTTLTFEKVGNSTISAISLVDSQAFHVKIDGCDHIYVSGINISAPESSPNTDGIHIGNSAHINITSSVIGTGDDCISVGPGTTNLFVSNITCGPGHGISVGSLGKNDNEMDVIGLQVRNCTIKSTDNGIRIKTWPGSDSSRANDFTFEDILMVNVSNPILIDQEYCPLHDCTDEPSQVEISNIMFRRIRGTSKTKVAINLSCSKEVPCKNVQLIDINLSCIGHNCNTTASCSNVDGVFSGTQMPTPCISGNSTSKVHTFPRVQHPPKMSWSFLAGKTL